jgi:hypothetical protein
LALVLTILLYFSGNATSQQNPAERGSGISAEKSEPASTLSTGPTIRAQVTKAIDGHLIIEPDDVLKEGGPPGEKFRKLRTERLWAVWELEQMRSELTKLVNQPHNLPVPVPVISESDYNGRIAEIDRKIREYESRQNNGDLTETQRADAHAQLIDLTRQKARAALELISYRQHQQEQARFDRLLKREENANAITSTTSDYLARIDQAVGELMMSSRDESWFRLSMGFGFLVLVSLLIGCFFYFASNSGSIREILRNDRGLQFITLFSLVIAITLFGLLNILEGKELAALLGGLSGYILGRSNLGTNEDRRTDNQGDINTSTAAKTQDNLPANR